MPKLIQLTVTPLDEQNACLIGVTGNVDANSIFAQVGKYEGYNHYQTPEDVTIGLVSCNDKTYLITQIKSCVFSHCRDIKNIHLGSSISLIDWNMYQCSSLLNIFVDKANKIFHDVDGVLFKESELIAFPQGRTGHYNVPYGTTRIGNHAFKSSSISSVSFPDTLKEIGINAFYECHHIKEFILPESIMRVSMNHDVGYKPISQLFYLSRDIERKNPLSIIQITELFPE